MISWPNQEILHKGIERHAKKSPDRSQGFSIGGLKRNRTAVNGFVIPIKSLLINSLSGGDTGPTAPTDRVLP